MRGKRLVTLVRAPDLRVRWGGEWEIIDLSAMTQDDKDEIYDDFYDAVNMQPAELEAWLATDRSKGVGQKDGGDESTGHRSGRRIVEIKRTNKANLTDADYDHMQKVVGYIHRHRAQRPSGDVEGTDWAASLKNWGYAPTR